MEQLAKEFTKVYESNDPMNVYCYSPSILCLDDGTILTSLDLGGPGVSNLDGKKGNWNGKTEQGKIFISLDKGKSFKHAADFPFIHARLFKAGKRLYILGHLGDIMIIYSEDNGITWSEPYRITEGAHFHQAPCSVCYKGDYVYMVMERRVSEDVKGWNVSAIAPVVIRGRVESDLTKAENWTFSDEFVFRDNIKAEELEYFGVPFYESLYNEAVDIGGGNKSAPIGILETNVVQIKDNNHYWYDKDERTIHLIMRTHTGGVGYAAILKAVENEDGTISVTYERTPSGKKQFYIPLPGGQMKFHIVYDEKTKLYWLLSTQSTDSMVKPELMPKNRFGLPNNERHRLQLHFSKNCVDWCFAGIVAMGEDQKCARHYASMDIYGDDLHILSRSGDEKAKSAHDTNFISYHVVKNFRDLVY